MLVGERPDEKGQRAQGVGTDLAKRAPRRGAHARIGVGQRTDQARHLRALGGALLHGMR